MHGAIELNALIRALIEGEEKGRIPVQRATSRNFSESMVMMDIQSLVNKGLIWSIGQSDIGTTFNGVYNDLNNINVLARISPAGEDFFRRKYLRRYRKNVRRWTIVAVLLAAVLVLFSLL
jgi:hypothetical protein